MASVILVTIAAQISNVFVLPLTALAAFVLHWPPVVVFACLKSDQITKCAVAVVKVNRYRWIRKFETAPAKKEA